MSSIGRLLYGSTGDLPYRHCFRLCGTYTTTDYLPVSVETAQRPRSTLRRRGSTFARTVDGAGLGLAGYFRPSSVGWVFGGFLPSQLSIVTFRAHAKYCTWTSCCGQTCRWGGGGTHSGLLRDTAVTGAPAISNEKRVIFTLSTAVQMSHVARTATLVAVSFTPSAVG